MAQRFPSDDNTDSTEETDVVDSSTSSTAAEQAILNEDAQRRAAFAEIEAKFARSEHQTAQGLRHLHKDDKAKELEDDAITYFQDAAQEMQRADQELQEARELHKHDEIERLSLVLKDQPRAELMDLSTAVTSVTSYVHGIDDRALATVTDGNVEAARRLRAHVVNLGSSIKHSLGRAIGGVDAARRVAQELVDFVAIIMNIAEHIAAVWEFVHQFPALGRFFV